jgi:hypothetical protein
MAEVNLKAASYFEKGACLSSGLQECVYSKSSCLSCAARALARRAAWLFVRLSSNHRELGSACSTCFVLVAQACDDTPEEVNSSKIGFLLIERFEKQLMT